ncbi:phenylacetate--CoA ligase family protein [Anaerosporobacter faecicola]|uniref:phenylacetate--CoA ligase family protein n=1 Tax=Anaerosporobacter faecicola TaxID=2718714 RepID=UPI001438AEC5|nr:AMP-binding protein [Anaerosporobacter faecicola]
MNNLAEYICFHGIRDFSVLKEYQEEMKDITKMSGEEIVQYQDKALKDLLDYVYERNTYYRSELDKIGYRPDGKLTKQVFEKLRLTTRETISTERDILRCVEKEDILHVHTSTGTSGAKSNYIMYTVNDLYGSDLLPKMGDLFELKRTDVVAIALPYEMSSAGQSFQRVVQIGYGATVLPVGKGGAYSEPKKAIQLMKDMDCNVLFSSPSYTVELMRAAEEEGIDLLNDLKIDQIWLTGEGCSDAFRKKIEKKWEADARFYYGSLECGAIGIECKEKNGYHIPISHIYLEIIDPETGEVLEDGEVGEIVVTVLLKEGTPLIRYRTQDLGFLDPQTCDCGIELKKLFLRGRKIDQIEIDGNAYAPIYVEEMLMRQEEVGENYYINVYPQYAEIVIELSSDTTYYEGIEEVISSKVEFACGIPNKIVVKERIPYVGKKAKRVNYIKEE